MKNACSRAAKGGGFRVEWESKRNGADALYLYGVESFGEYEAKCRRFRTGGEVIAVYGENLAVLTYRSGCVEVCGRILGVSREKGKEDADGARV